MTIELPTFKIQYRRHTEFEEERGQSKKYKFGTPKVIITKSGDLKSVFPIEEIDVNTIKSNL